MIGSTIDGGLVIELAVIVAGGLVIRSTILVAVPGGLVPGHSGLASPLGPPLSIYLPSLPPPPLPNARAFPLFP